MSLGPVTIEYAPLFHISSGTGNDDERQNPERAAAMKARLDAFSKEAARPLFMLDQMGVMKNRKGEPVMPTEEGCGGD